MTKQNEPGCVTLPCTAADQDGKALRVVRGMPIEALQQVPYFVGVSRKTTGACGLSMQLVVIPPGENCRPHLHIGSESAIYIVSGRTSNKFGPSLSQSIEAGPGDFVYVPANEYHQGCNLSDTDPVIAIVARNDSDEQANIKLYSPE